MYCLNIWIASDMPIARTGHLNACWSCYNHARTIYKLMITMHAWQERLETKTKESHKTKPNHQLCIILTACSNNNSSLSINTICRCICYTDIYHKNEFAQFEINQPSHACCYKKRLKVQESLLADTCQVTCAYMQQRCKAQYFLIDGGADQYVLILKGPNFFSAALTITV